MKILNITLSIVIFLLAAASAVFSYFLFEKRAQFVNSHSAMATAIRESSVALDPTSDITMDKLAHHKHAELNGHLALFKKQVDAVIEQRNRMGDALHVIGGNVGVKSNPTKEEYRSLEMTQGNIKRVQNQVRSVVTNRKETVDAIVRLGGKYRVKISDGALYNASDDQDYLKALSPLTAFVDSVINTRNTYGNVLKQVALAAGARVNVRTGSDANTVLVAVRKKAAEVAGLSKKLREMQNENRRLTASNNAKDKQLTAAARRYADSQNALRDLKASIGVAQDFVPWKPGSEEARSRLFGKVVNVDRELGYFVIDLGANSVVYQTSNKKRLPVRLNLDDKVEVMVIRGNAGNSNPELWLNKDGSVVASADLVKMDVFVASSCIKKVGENACVLDIPVGADINVGDIVLYKGVKKD